MLSNKYVIALPLVLALSLPAVAGTSKNVTQEDALDGRVPVVVAAEGGGTVIDFGETGETIQKVSLDDPSKVIVDYSAPLPVIRLFRGNISSGDIPSVRKTQLTVVTQDSDKQYRTYIFPVTPSSKPAIYTKFVVGGVTRKKSTGVITTTAFGVRQAENQRTLVDPALKGRVRRYLQLTQGGMSDRKAAKKAGISMSLARRLETLGQGSTQMAQALPVTQPSILPVPVVPVLAKSVPVKPLEPPKVAQVPVPSPVPVASPSPSPSLTPEAKPKTEAQPPRHKVVKTLAKTKTINHQTYANALLKGLTKARLDGKIRYRSNQWYSVNSAIRALRWGGSLERAIALSGMKRDRFMQLLSDGGLVV